MQEYAVLRWGIVAGFVITAVIVVARFSEFTHPVGSASSADLPSAEFTHPVGSASSADLPSPSVAASADPESDVAHLLMCLVMLAMLVFPMAASPQALRGVLVAMLVAYSAVLAVRLHALRRGDRAGRAAAFGYHLAAVAAMLWATPGPGMNMSHGGHSMPMLLLAALFAADAVLMVVPGQTSLVRRALGHSYGPIAVIPHVVMDLGTAFMLVAAATG